MANMTPSLAFPHFHGPFARCPLCAGDGRVLEEACCGGWGEWGCCGAKVERPALCHWCEGEGALPLPVAREMALLSGNPAFFAQIEAEAMAEEMAKTCPSLAPFSRRQPSGDKSADAEFAAPQTPARRRL